MDIGHRSGAFSWRSLPMRVIVLMAVWLPGSPKEDSAQLGQQEAIWDQQLPIDGHKHNLGFGEPEISALMMCCRQDT